MTQSPIDSFGELAIKAGFVTVDQVRECLMIQNKMREMGIVPKKLDEILIEKGFMTPAQAQAIDVGEAAASPATPPPPSESPKSSSSSKKKKTVQIPGYELTAKIGQGGMGTVYKAYQVSMDRDVAIKILPPRLAKDPTFVERFTREARAVARLNHENIISGIDFGEVSGYYYFVMEFVEGITVRSELRKRGMIDEKESLDIGLQIAHALEHAHHHDMVHRDVKPENIMKTRNGIVKLCDLGLAKDTGGDASVTQTGISVGTPHYISPEQARGEENIDIRTDIYSLGASLYHMVTGTFPFEGPTPAVVMTKHVNEKLEPPIDRNPAISDGMNNLIMKMMAKDKNKRYQTPDDLIEDIHRVMEGESLGPRRPGARRTPARGAKSPQDSHFSIRRAHTPRKSGPPIGIILVAAVLVLGVVGFLMFGGGGGAPPGPNPNGSSDFPDFSGSSGTTGSSSSGESASNPGDRGRKALQNLETFANDNPTKRNEVYDQYIALVSEFSDTDARQPHQTQRGL
jgi:serine/threonine-protein kinase